jgi:DNA-binding MarR family transcriptional regulator
MSQLQVGGPQTIKQLAVTLECSITTVRRALAQWKFAGYIARQGDFQPYKYELTAAGRKRLDNAIRDIQRDLRKRKRQS